MIIITAVAVVLWCAGAASASTKWAIQPTPNPGTRDYDNQLNSISCNSDTSCTAVGWFGKSNAHKFPVAEYWDGSTWVIQLTPPRYATP